MSLSTVLMGWSGAHLVDVREPDGPDAGYAVAYVWHGGPYVGVYGITDYGNEVAEIEGFTMGEGLCGYTRDYVLEQINDHYRKANELAEILGAES